MSVLPVGFGSSGGLQITNSVRLRAAASAYFSRTFGSPTTQDTFTFSAWVKRSKLATLQNLLGVSTNTSIGFPAADTLVVTIAGSATITTSGLYRDPSAWCHVQYKQTTGSATLYFNGTSVGTSATVSAVFNTAVAHQLGAANTSNYHDGYLSDIYFIDGQALTPSSFGETNSDGVWVPKAYTGTYGTNGFHLDFKDATSLTTLGYDAAGSNDWTCNNISLTAGVTYDSFTDTPTNNYATLNPLDVIGTGSNTFSNANLQVVTNVATSGAAHGSVGMSSGKWYWEMSPTAGATQRIGIENALNDPRSGYLGGNTSGFCYDIGGNKINNGSSVAYGNSYTTTDTISIAYDADSGKLWFAKNGTWQASGDPAAGTNAAYTTATVTPYYPAYSDADNSTSSTASFNFGQRPFAYTPPTGFKALCTANLPAVAITKPSEHHNVYTVTKSGNTNFTLDWNASTYDTYFEIKRRDAAGDWYNVDGLRGYDKILKSNSTAAETTDANVISVSGTTCTLGSTLTDGTYVIAAWKAGLTASRQTNTDGSITSTVSRNVTSGFAIVLYTGTAANATVGHGLVKVPASVITGRRATGGAYWAVYAEPLGNTKALWMQMTSAADTNIGYWNNTTPTSTVFSIGISANTNAAGTMVAYCFAEIPGYSKFGSYTGNGSADGPNPNLGFKARWTRTKNASAAEGWEIVDSARDTYNVAKGILEANNANAEDTSVPEIDLTANSIKVRNTRAAYNTAGHTYIYSAYADEPFGGENVAPATAR